MAASVPRAMSAPRVVAHLGSSLGEGLCWSAREAAIYWVDILQHRLHRAAADGSGHREWRFDETISAVAERRSQPGLAVTLRRGLALFDPVSGELTRLAEPEPEREGNRFNDGKCDAQGRFWGCTMDFGASAPTGALYRFDPTGQAVRAADLLWPVVNGPTWSLDGRTIYVNDTVHRRVVAFPFDAQTGTLGAPRDWLVLPPEDGHPDGMTTDAAGRLWIAHWGGSCVTCHDPDTAAELARIELPTAHVSNVAFGGAAMTTLFISTARHELGEARLAEQPLAGALFAVDTDAIGLPANLFGA